jgi:hypothetical protein
MDHPTKIVGSDSLRYICGEAWRRVNADPVLVSPYDSDNQDFIILTMRVPEWHSVLLSVESMNSESRRSSLSHGEGLSRSHEMKLSHWHNGTRPTPIADHGLETSIGRLLLTRETVLFRAASLSTLRVVTNPSYLPCSG